MKKSIILFALTIIALAISGCEEDETPLKFSTVSVDNPDNVKVEYFSPDPCCRPKSYWITTNDRASQLTLKCANSSSIYISHRADEGSSSSTGTSFTSYRGKWSAKVIDSNKITFTFDEIDDETPFEYEIINDYITIYTKVKGETVNVTIDIRRILKYSGPINS